MRVQFVAFLILLVNYSFRMPYSLMIEHLKLFSAFTVRHLLHWRPWDVKSAYAICRNENMIRVVFPFFSGELWFL